LCRYFGDLTSERRMAERPEQNHPRSIDVRRVRSPRRPMRSYRRMPCRSRWRVEIAALLQRQCACSLLESVCPRDSIQQRYRQRDVVVLSEAIEISWPRQCALEQPEVTQKVPLPRFFYLEPVMLDDGLDGQPSRLTWQVQLGFSGISRCARGSALHSQHLRQHLPRSGAHARSPPLPRAARRPAASASCGELRAARATPRRQRCFLQ
jgi:hypothetical protein